MGYSDPSAAPQPRARPQRLQARTAASSHTPSAPPFPQNEVLSAEWAVGLRRDYDVAWVF